MTLYDNLTGDYLIHHGIEIHFIFKKGYSINHTGFIMYALYNELLENANLSPNDNVLKCGHYDIDELYKLPKIIENYIKSTKIYKANDLKYIEIYCIPNNGYPTSGSYIAPTDGNQLLGMTAEEISLKYTCVFENIDELLICTDLKYNKIMCEYDIERAKAGYVKSLHGNVKFKSDPRWEFVKTLKEKQGGLLYNVNIGSFYCGAGGSIDDPRNYINDR